MQSTSSRDNTRAGEKGQHNPCHVVVDLMSVDDPDKWIPPTGPAIAPPKHIQELISQRRLHKRDHSTFSTRQFQKLPSFESDVNLRKDFFEIQHPKNAHHVDYELVDYFRHRKREKMASSVNYATGWFVLKQIYNPEVFEAMSELITPIENYEFYAAFQNFLAYVHNSTIIFQLRSKEDSVEIWSRNFCKKLVQLGETRPSSYHTVVIPMILKPIETRDALVRVSKEWRKTSLASWVVPAFSGYGRAVNRWILPLTEPFEEDNQGVLRKPQKKSVRLDLGYLFSQRRRFGKLSRLQQVSSELGRREPAKSLAYRVVQKNQEQRKPGSRRNFRGKPQSKHSLMLGISQVNPSKVTSTIGGQRGSIRHLDTLNPSALTVKPRKFLLERLLRANKRKPPLERLYWIHYLRRNTTQPPSVFAKLYQSGQRDIPVEKQTEPEFLATYYPIARRELYKEPEKDPTLLHSQYDPNVVRDMIKEEISAAFSNARSQINGSDALVSTAQGPIRRQAELLRDHVVGLERQLFNNRVTPIEEDPLLRLADGTSYQKQQYVDVLSKNHVVDLNLGNEPKNPEIDPKAKYLVGSGNLNSVQKWSVLTNEISNKTLDPGSVPKTLSHNMRPSLNVRDVLLDPAKDSNEENSLFVRLVIDSGYKYFYFEIGGDSDEEEDMVPEAREEPVPAGDSSRRRQSSLAVEQMPADTFDYLDKGALDKVGEMFSGMRGQPYDEWMDEEYRKVTDELRSEFRREPTRNGLDSEKNAETVVNAEALVPSPPRTPQAFAGERGNMDNSAGLRFHESETSRMFERAIAS